MFQLPIMFRVRTDHYFLTDAKDESEYTQLPPVTIMVKPVSGLCDMRCTYCFYADEMSHRFVPLYKKMSEQTQENMVRRVLLYAEGQLTIAFQGGEPTLAGVEYYRRLLKLEERYNTRQIVIQHCLQTNGYSLSDDLIEVFKQGHFLIGISIDGTKKFHDEKRVDAAGRLTYDRVMITVEKLRKEKIDYNILCVVDRRIAQNPKAVYEALSRHGYLQFIPCLDGLDGNTHADSLTAKDYGNFLVKMFDLYERDFRRDRIVSMRMFDNWLGMVRGYPPENCGFSGQCSINYLIESNGNVYPCDFYALDEWLMGNINVDSFYRLAHQNGGKSLLCHRSKSV